jgi:hypothetical protein
MLDSQRKARRDGFGGIVIQKGGTKAAKVNGKAKEGKQNHQSDGTKAAKDMGLCLTGEGRGMTQKINTSHLVFPTVS